MTEAGWPAGEDYLVPDVLQEGLTLVLVGTAPSRISARAKAYYANPENKFWRVLAETGLTPRQLAPREYPILPQYGIGLTDVAKRHSGVDAALPVEAWAPHELREKIRRYRPAIVAFTSKRGASETLGVPTGRLPYGPQVGRLEGAEVWVLPSTSPLGHTHFQLGPWQALADRVRALRPSGNREARRNPGAPERVP
ncbi:Uracil-DNA glycosylase superfamily [Deinococcus geothermalis DSM 11300]|uniref:Uracil-DNA glycosylase superfamily n=1 Tax=Deinococcus geothermalis (strain DSM 11300 / CIP 105573 / AG-3a) TaxID=319795 RepID=Q1IXM1_DEIGD|nr:MULTISPECIES: mismatch-specific DNA-glycosylase [Deinococcus]ABF46013.1 Uracil-DNA glycosylase superfamily [Deinococcus geothermalis DSM 11300]MBI0445318.1 mismatch-specific DNA-glycosylase [Deinococcus sp. DB0503]TDE85775.1 mismatch-specific DNA-glycosylase [Deinococcus sp. S9]